MTQVPTIVGKWPFAGMSTWDNDYINLVEPGYITFATRNRREMAFGVNDDDTTFQAPRW